MVVVGAGDRSTRNDSGSGGDKSIVIAMSA